ncbi:hypothetical protein [Streptomyces sp. FIT100]|uniref:hypothetical protein n=1 Tax=Streptomyces sp. FIT100 TaxID=2837956 RepID=UPI0021C7F914|nr:hypothetical protein [Streptomyces sp. FIT100]UUN28855.1 hypothetical protein KK483_22570 [Streptomyces sp. FIT100]
MPRLLPLIVIAIAVYFWVKNRRGTGSRATAPATADPVTDTRAVELGFLPKEAVDGKLAGPRAPELTTALETARTGGWEPAAALLAATGKDWQRRSQYVAALGRVAADEDPWLLTWEKARPDDPDAAAVRAESTVTLAGQVRGAARAKDTTQEQFDGFHRLMFQARADVARAAESAPDDDPTPAIIDIWVGIALGRPHDEMRALFARITARAPYHYEAHYHALQYWCQKWRGSVQLATDFAAHAAASAPLGSLFHAFPLICYYEHEAFGHTSRGFNTPEVSTLVDALAADVATADPDHPRLREVRLLLTWYLVRLKRYPEALQQFRVVDGYAGAFPWFYFPDPVEKYVAARELTVRKAG